MLIRWISAAAVAVLVSGIACGMPQPSSATSLHTRPSGSVTSAEAANSTAGVGGGFIALCKYSHTANDDPIMMTAQPGMSMLHEFFANRSTNANSTYASLQAAPASTCISPADSAAYWVPALYSKGVHILPNEILAYYDAMTRLSAPRVADLPPGLQMIAGNEKATGPQDVQKVWWSCAARTKGQQPLGPFTSPRVCPSSLIFSLHIRFPECWDGVTLSGANQTNVVFAAPGGVCPADHRVLLPGLLLDITYPIRGGDITLSTGPGTEGSPYTAHADFINAWNQPIVNRLVRECDVLFDWCGVIGPDNQPTK